MSDGHYKILLLLVCPELSSHGPVNKNCSKENQYEEGRSLSNIFCIVAHSLVRNFFLFGGIVGRIGWNGGLQVFHAKAVHRFVMCIKGEEPPYKGGNDKRK